MINKAENTLENRLVARLEALEREVRASKTKQVIGADNLAVLGTSTITVTQTIAAGVQNTFAVPFYGSVRQLYLSELGIAIYINNDDDPDSFFPEGASLTSDLRALSVSYYYDPIYSDEVGSGMKRYIVRIKNEGTASKTVFVKLKLIFPAQEITA